MVHPRHPNLPKLTYLACSQKMKGQESLEFEHPHAGPGLVLNEWPDGGQTEGCCSYTGCRDNSCENTLLQETKIHFQGPKAMGKGENTLMRETKMDIQGPKAMGKSDTGNSQAPTRPALHVNSMTPEGQRVLNAAVSKEHLEVVKNLLGGGPNVNKSDTRGRTLRGLAEQQGNKSICDLLLSYENRSKPDKHKTEFIGPEAGESNGFLHSHLKGEPNSSHLSTSSSSGDPKEIQPTRKRVTIHMQFYNRSAHLQHGKLIILPDSIDELLKIAGKPFIDARIVLS